jgi:2-polyprenyl-6-methoxyphenol hydroxylase-like FAD-dependent oxidoreductase
MNSRLQVGKVYFAGDAAHIHSPVGARGMNLGLEDAWVFARLVNSQRMDRYEALRRPVDQDVVKRVELFSRVVCGESFASRLARAAMARWLVKVPAVVRRVMPIITGTDHPLEPL